MNNNWNLIGHEWAVDMLKKHVINETTRHAYLFAGPPGLGRRTLALRFAQALNCQTPVAEGIPCGACRDCKQIAAMQYADLTVVQADSEGGTLKVDQIREARRTLTLKPYQAKYRVALFLRFQEANDNAANALLKTLEEAPAYAVLILTADNPEQLLPTIVSRCEVLRLRPLEIEKVKTELENRGVESGPANLIAHISGGRFGYALRMIENEALLEQREEQLNALQNLISASRVEKFAYADKLSRDKESMRQTVLIWLSYWRDVMLRSAQAETPLINVDRNVEIEDLAGRLNLSIARTMVSGLEDVLEKMERNVNSRMLAEVLLLDLPKV
ncbi:MAG TPA: DNA polymerase III subunit delta' C-terminal domain-containing protein [Anaerolineales bacterium]|nr:DNA polymerase III subunit delta' C-terminal domain-containing protein [Anaerolineales bacterium]HLO29374.1 DNA polymerase III subunit delta' C-terminal domain-containing protein [Anaerolineales bacterium]